MYVKLIRSSLNGEILLWAALLAGLRRPHLSYLLLSFLWPETSGDNGSLIVSPIDRPGIMENPFAIDFILALTLK